MPCEKRILGRNPSTKRRMRKIWGRGRTGAIPPSQSLLSIAQLVVNKWSQPSLPGVCKSQHSASFYAPTENEDKESSFNRVLWRLSEFIYRRVLEQGPIQTKTEQDPVWVNIIYIQEVNIKFRKDVKMVFQSPGGEEALHTENSVLYNLKT